MAYQTIRIKNTNVAGKVPNPVDIDVAELCVNLKDHTLFSKDVDGNIFELVGGGIGVGPTPPIIDNEIGDLWWDGDVLLVWNGTDWEQVAPVTSVNGETGDVVLALDDLSDVTTTGASEGDILILQSGTWVPASPSSLTADVDLGYTPAPTGGIVTNTAGDDSNLPLVDNTNAGLMSPDDKDKLDGLPDTVVAPNDGELTILDSNSGILGTFSANQAGDDTITLPAGFSGDYNDLTNQPTIPAPANDGILTIKNNDGTANSTFSADQAGNTELILPKSFSGSYGDLTGTPTIGDGTITINQGGTQKATFTVNQTGNTIVNLDAGSSGSSGLQGAEVPLSVNGTNVKLNYAKGLHVVSDKLETYLGDGLAFDGDRMKVQFPTNAVLNYRPQARKIDASDTMQWTGAGTDGGREERSFEFTVEPKVDGFVTITTFRLSMLPNPNEDYGSSGDGNVATQRVEAIPYMKVSGRNAFCETSSYSDKISLTMAMSTCWSGGPRGSGNNWFKAWYAVRVDEWRCDQNNDRIRCTFGLDPSTHNKVELRYNGGCRCAILPFDKA